MFVPNVAIQYLVVHLEARIGKFYRKCALYSRQYNIFCNFCIVSFSKTGFMGRCRSLISKSACKCKLPHPSNMLIKAVMKNGSEIEAG